MTTEKNPWTKLLPRTRCLKNWSWRSKRCWDKARLWKESLRGGDSPSGACPSCSFSFSSSSSSSCGGGVSAVSGVFCGSLVV